MTIQELANACIDSMNHPERSAPCAPVISLVHKKKGGGFPRRGWPKPVQTWDEVNGRGYVHLYDAASVLAAMAAHGLVEVQS